MNDTRENEPKAPPSADEDDAAHAPAENPGQETHDHGAENVTDGDDDKENDEEENDEEENDGEENGGEEAGVLPLSSVLEALLFAARGALSDRQLARCVGRGTRRAHVREALEELNRFYRESGRAFEILEVAGKYQLMSKPEFARHVLRLFPRKEEVHRFTPAALDTLSIVAYKQPITRVEIEAIRGVGCGPVMRNLVERGLVRVVGKKAEVTGQPWLYGTTELFLREFGLASLEELPMVNELRRATGTQDPVPSGENAPDADNRPLVLHAAAAGTAAALDDTSATTQEERNSAEVSDGNAGDDDADYEEEEEEEEETEAYDEDDDYGEEDD